VGNGTVTGDGGDGDFLENQAESTSLAPDNALMPILCLATGLLMVLDLL